GEATAPGAHVKFDDMPSSTADLFDALAREGTLARVAATGDDLHGDAVWCEREVDVVVPHDGLLVEVDAPLTEHVCEPDFVLPDVQPARMTGDRKSTRLNSSHVSISYAVFCLKKKK